MEALYNQDFVFFDRDGHSEVRISGKNINLYRSEDGFMSFWIKQPRNEMTAYEYVDVLDGRVPRSAFKDAIVVIAFGEISKEEYVAVSGSRSVSRGEYHLRTLASLLSSFAPYRVASMTAAVLTIFLTLFSACIGFEHFKRSFIFLVCLFVAYVTGVALLFLKGGLWLPLVGPLLFALCGYVGSQAILSWHLDNEWNVRSLSIKPLLALTQAADAGLDGGLGFDEYLRSLWGDIEEKTGVILKSTQVDENFAVVQNYLLRAQKMGRQGENFHIIKNATSASPRHRMLLPLPFWNDRNAKNREAYARKYVILAWDGNIPTETLTSLAALTLFAAVHFRALEEGRRRKEMLFKTIEAIMMAVEAKDPTTSEHSRRVANLSRQLAQWMHLNSQEIEDVYFSAIIHDIGKLGIDDSILKKPAALTENEVAIMHRHPSIGEDIMRPVDLPDYVVSGIIQHHERHDGKGYPFGIKGERMTMVGKIIKVADVFDALMNRRQYKEPWTEDRVRGFLLQRRGTEFDPQIVDIFLENLSGYTRAVEKENSKTQ
jgi:HD-GYP domain-containing protein (c-di-GMP phosphodiesterase class II)